MKKGLMFILLVLPAVTFAQPRDLNGLTSVPYFSTGPQRGPSRTTVTRFDKRIIISNPNSDGRGSETFLFINTRNGDIGIIVNPATPAGQEMNVDHEKFRLMIVTKSGEVTTFLNQRRRGEMVKVAMSGQTELQPVTFSSPTGVLHRQADTLTYHRRSYSARAYRADSGPILYLVGSRTPERLVIQDSLAYSGIGYLKTDRGVFMVLELGDSFRAVQWDNVNVSFDKQPYELAEAGMFAEANSNIDDKLAKLGAKEPRFSGDCSDLENQRTEIKKRDLRRQKELLERTQGGNVYQNQGVIAAYAELQDPTAQLELTDMDTRVSICKAESARSKAANGGENFARLSRKIQCLNNLLLEIQRTKLEADAITERYRNDPKLGLPEKRRLMSSLMTRRCD